MSKLFVDDKRQIPPSWHDWYVCSKIEDAKHIIKSVHINLCSLDHDMPDVENAGLHFVKWMCEQHLVPSIVAIHSANPAGAMNMKSVLETYNKVFNTDKKVIVYDYSYITKNNINDIEYWDIK